jgi:hypothetical protein
MGDFVLELYLPRIDEADFSRAVSRMRAAAEAVSGSGQQVRHLHSIFVPEDETCFHVFSADSAEGVRLVADRAAVPVQRITEAVSDDSPG